MIRLRSGSGRSLLLIGYIVVFVLLAGVVGLVLMHHRQQPSNWISIQQPAPPASAPSPATATLPPTAPAAAIVLAPAPISIAPPKPVPAPAPPPAVEPQSALAPVGADGYPPPPPEKPIFARPSSELATAKPPPGSDDRTTTPAGTAPDSGNTPSAKSAYGPLPHIAANGLLPWIVNDGRFDHLTRIPRIAVLVVGLGFDAGATEDAIVKLPAEVSLGFLPYTPNLARWTKLARNFGHEVLIGLPLDSGDPKTQQALGPRMLSPKLDTAENLDRLRWVLAQATDYIGLVTWNGEAFLADADAVRPVLREISNRGLMVVDSRMAPPNTIQDQADGIGLPFAKSRGFIDDPRDAASIDANLSRLEDMARQNRFALAMAVAFPVSIDRLVNWSRTVTQRGFVLSPITGVTQCTELCQARVRRHAAAVQAMKKSDQ